MLEHLRAHVVGCASEGGGKVGRPHQNTGDSEVTQLYQVALHEDVPEPVGV